MHRLGDHVEVGRFTSRFKIKFLGSLVWGVAPCGWKSDGCQTQKFVMPDLVVTAAGAVHKSYTLVHGFF